MSEGEELQQQEVEQSEKTSAGSLTDAVMMQKQNSAVDQWTDGAAGRTVLNRQSRKTLRTFCLLI